VCLLAFALVSTAPRADSSIQAVPFAQDWNGNVVTVTDNWGGVPGIMGYRGDGLAGEADDPATVVAEGSGTPVDVNANQTNPSTYNTGGVTEFEGANVGGNPVIALAGSGTADAPHIVISVNTSALSNITVTYDLRDLDGSLDNAISPVALQYRVGSSGNYTNVPEGFVGDASAGPGLATLVTPVSALLPADAANQPLVQVRIITTNASGNDEWIGIDDISITGSAIATPTNPTGIGAAAPSSAAPGESALLTVQVTEGQNPASTDISVIADLSSIGGNAAQELLNNGANGDINDDDGIYSFIAEISPATATGAKTLPVTITDVQGRSTSTNIGLVVFTPITSVTISQVYGGGGNAGATYTHDFIELYNRSASPVDVTGWSVQYASSGGSSWQVTPVSGVIQPGTYYLVQQAAGSGGTVPLPPPDASGSILMAAGSGKVALVAAAGALTGSCPAVPSIVDFVGFGSANCAEGNAATPTLSNTTAAIREDGGATDTNNNAADFVTGPPSPKNRTGQPPVGTGRATPASLDSGETSLLTVAVRAGNFPPSTAISVIADLALVGGAALQPFFDDGTSGDVTAGDLVFSFSSVITGTEGNKAIAATVNDAEGRSTTTTFSVAIQPQPIPIHVIQGSGSTSGYEGQLVSTTGIVTAIRSSSFYIQTPDADMDGDPATSQGLLVFSGFPRPDGFTVGDLVRVTGTVVEFRPTQDPQSLPITELSGPSVRLIGTGFTLPAPAVLLPSYTSPSGNTEQLERFEGMRVRADITAVTGTGSFTRTAAHEATGLPADSNGDFFAVISGVARPMRELGLEPGRAMPASPCCIPQFDGNPEKLRVDSDGQIGAATIEIVAGQSIAGFTGVLDYGFRSYTIVPDPQAWVPAGRGEALPVPVASTNEFTVGTFNVERFFDTTDDPTADEVVLTPAALELRLAKASLAIRNVMRIPDIIGIVEIENLSTLQTLADRVNVDAAATGQPNPEYTAHLFEGNDIGGIDVGFLVKSARLSIVRVVQVGKDTRYLPPGAAGTALLNDRPPLMLEAAVRAEDAEPYPITVIVNHLRSLSGIAGNDGDRVREKRRQQAEFLANYIQGRQAANPAERIISVGDYNAFQFSDGYVDLVGTIKGQPTAADNVLLASLDLVNPDLTNVGDALGADQYSFVFDGNAQTLDHVLVNAAAMRRFSRMAYARNNADFPESLRGDASRPERLSDHDMAVAYFTLPGAPVITLTGSQTMTVEAMSTFADPGAVATDEELGPLPVSISGAIDTAVPGAYTLTYSATNLFKTTLITRTVNVVDTTAPVVTLAGDAAMTIEAGSAWTDPGATASDTRAGDLTGAIELSGMVNAAVVGTYTLTYTVSDGFNSGSATRVVTVADTTAPAVTALSVTPSTIAVPNHKMVDVSLSYTASDLTGPTICSITVTSNEPINGPGDGNTTVDWQVLSATAVRIRAERSGRGTGRVYGITVTCADASGNRGSSSATVRVGT
jgi:predicted extracellular nuclease